MKQQHPASNDQEARRAHARRTALWVGGVALAIYVIAILQVVLKR